MQLRSCGAFVFFSVRITLFQPRSSQRLCHELTAAASEKCDRDHAKKIMTRTYQRVPKKRTREGKKERGGEKEREEQEDRQRELRSSVISGSPRPPKVTSVLGRSAGGGLGQALPTASCS